MYLVCDVAHEQAHIASPGLHSGSNIVSDSHSFRSKLTDPISEIMATWKFNFENPSPRSWVRLKVKVT